MPIEMVWHSTRGLHFVNYIPSTHSSQIHSHEDDMVDGRRSAKHMANNHNNNNNTLQHFYDKPTENYRMPVIRCECGNGKGFGSGDINLRSFCSRSSLCRAGHTAVASHLNEIFDFFFLMKIQ